MTEQEYHDFAREQEYLDGYRQREKEDMKVEKQ